MMNERTRPIDTWHPPTVESARLELHDFLEGTNPGDVKFMAHADHSRLIAAKLQYEMFNKKTRFGPITDAHDRETALLDWRLARQTILERYNSIPEYANHSLTLTNIFHSMNSAQTDLKDETNKSELEIKITAWLEFDCVYISVDASGEYRKFEQRVPTTHIRGIS